jgi:drug/metabolite transporter (DMT)-like permease
MAGALSGAYLGQFAALVTAGCWTVSALVFETAGKRLGSLTLNLLRLVIAFVFLSIFSLITRGMPLPFDATRHEWIWLTISGVIGLVVGDLFLFRAFIVIGSRITMLIMALVPLFTSVIGWIVMGETLSLGIVIGMILTVGGIVLVVLEREKGNGQVQFSRPLPGILLALGGALGQASGLVLSKYGMGSYDPFSATQIRGIAGIFALSILFCIMRAWNRLPPAIRDGKAMLNTTLGAFFGPFLGVSFSLLSVQYTRAGVASTIMAIVPVLIIPPAMIFLKERVTLKETTGALIAVGGVALLFLLK